MEDKYYTPSIEEFHVGFEYEWLNISNDEWLKKKYGSFECSYNSPERTRVKYLDQEDIESLGGSLIRTQSWDGGVFEQTYKLEKLDILYNPTPLNKCWVHIQKGNCTLFAGRIRNKSELKKMLKQIGYGEL